MASGLQNGPTSIARRSYRQRRLRDAALMMPILGTILWLLPVAATAPSTATTGIYIFGVWIVLIILAAMLARRIDHAPEQSAHVDDI